MNDDFGYTVQRLPATVLDALHDSSGHLARAVNWSAYRTMRSLRPALVHADGALTRHGLRVQGWLWDNNHTPTHRACEGCDAR